MPLWALSYVFGHDPMYWFRLECRFGGNSIVGTTVRKTRLPEHLLADEHHQTCDGNKVYLATTVGGGCCLGVAVAESASTDDLTGAYRGHSSEGKLLHAKWSVSELMSRLAKGPSA